MRERYEDDQIYCTGCTEQPEYFNEVLASPINRVAPDGSLIDPQDYEVDHYECPRCRRVASWGWVLNEKRQ